MLDMIFLTGHRKSGTTMFHKLFDGHPGITVYPADMSLLYAYFPCFTNSEDFSENDLKIRIEKVLKTTLNRAKERDGLSNSVLNINFFVEKFWTYLEGKNIRSRCDIISAVAEAWYESTQESKKKPFVFKETSQAIHFFEIINEIPKCKFINIVRDPRDNYAALKAGVEKYYLSFGEGEKETLSSLINRARMDMMVALLYQRDFPDQFLALRFEDLTANSENEMKKVAMFSGIKFDECLLQPTLFGKLYAGNSHNGKKFSAISDQNVGQWKNRISDFEAQIIEFWLGDIMEQWGYKREFPQKKCAESFGEFYKWYNCRYFFYDSFANDQ